jgi:hypothetical protein
VNTVVTSPRCYCGHVKIHHTGDNGNCGHVSCKCGGFQDPNRCPICQRRYAKTSDGFNYCRGCQVR